MNDQHVSINSEAMRRVTEQEQGETEDIERAVEDALIAHGHAVVLVDDGTEQRRQEETRAKAETEAQRQRDLDTAMADVIEVVARQRSRLGRRVCSSHDGSTVRKMFDLLRGMNGLDSGESGFGS